MPLTIRLSLLFVFSLTVYCGHLSAQPLTADAPIFDGPVIEEPAQPPFASPERPFLQRREIKEEDLTDDPSGVSPLRTSLPGEPGSITLEQPRREGGQPIELKIDIEPRPQEGAQEREGSEASEVVDTEAPPDADDPGSLIAKIKPETTPRRAASLRLTEEGRQLVDSGEYRKALQQLEKTIAIDSTNPYSYYYLGLVHFQMANHQASANFLDVAESLLSREPYWLARVYVLKGKNFQVQGALEQADASYASALKLDPNNQSAFEALTQINNDTEKSF